MRKLIEDTKQAITELIDQLYLESKYSTYCAMVVEMHSTGHTTKEISEQLEISENQVAEMLQAGSVSRKELCRVVGVGDRTLRSMIADARRRVCICNSQDGAGYYLPSSVNQAKAFYAQERKRADSIIKSLRGTSKFIKNSESKQREEMNGQNMLRL